MLQVRLCRDATTPTAGNLPSTPIWIPVPPYFLREHMGCMRATHARCRTRITAETQENSQLCESTTFPPAGLLLHFLSEKFSNSALSVMSSPCWGSYSFKFSPAHSIFDIFSFHTTSYHLQHQPLLFCSQGSFFMDAP